jgi:peptidoglycan/xylan/chitin deacetylase (PgdA/CDA1 family)
LRLRYTVAVIIALAALGAGCARHGTGGRPPPKAPQARHGTPAPKPVDLARVKPNELGQVMILEYHEIGPREGRWTRTPASFRKDLQRLYDLGYRPVSLRSYVTDSIDTPAGRTPVVITFDDSTRGQFRMKPDGTTDPDSAFGMLMGFHIRHPEFQPRATFYITYPTPFGQTGLEGRKMKEIVRAGMDIGNHTFSHRSLKGLTADGAAREIASAVREGMRLAPDARIDSIALPYGESPRDREIPKSGSADGATYSNVAALLVGANPAPSPSSRAFDPYRLPRIQAVDSSIESYGIEQWLGYFKKHPDRRYVSDGDARTISFPESAAGELDESRLDGRRVRQY